VQDYAAALLAGKSICQQATQDNDSLRLEVEDVCDIFVSNLSLGAI
jgi:hypothetical protein